MSVINEERLNQIKEVTILENALSMYSLYEYKFEEGKVGLKWLYKRHKEEFIRKFKQKFPGAGDDKIKNFIRIYLKPTFDNEKKDLGDFMFYDQDGDEWPINRNVL